MEGFRRAGHKLHVYFGIKSIQKITLRVIAAYIRTIKAVCTHTMHACL